MYHPNEEEKQDPKLYARNVRNLMARELGIPISDYTFDDCKLMTFVKNVNMPYAAYSADIEKLRKALGFGTVWLVQSGIILTVDFCRLHKRNVEEQLVVAQATFMEENSYFTMEEFARRLDIPVVDESTKKLFRIFVKVSSKNLRYHHCFFQLFFFSA